MNNKEIIIARTDDLQNGEMKTIELSDQKAVLLIRIEDQYYVTDAYCPHYGAPLEHGIISDKKIMCPWHHAVFNVKTGHVSEPPSIENLKYYRLDIRDGNIILFDESLHDEENQNVSVTANQNMNDQTFIIIGAGAAGNSAAREIRSLGYTGRLKVITADSQPPYDRTILSKDYLKGEMDPQWLPLNQDDFFERNKIELIKNRYVTNINTFNKEVELDKKTKLKYDKLLVATGSVPKKLSVPGTDLENIFTLRTVDDAEKILKASNHINRIVVVGSSFIGLETADSLNNGNRQIHVIAPESTPFVSTLGEDVGKLIQNKMEEKGITFHLPNNILEFRGNDTLNEVILDNDKSIQAEMAIVGIGVTPVSDFLPPHYKVTDGSLLTDRYLQVEKDIYAAGDITTFPYWKTNELIRIEHWRVAQQHGIIAAKNMMGAKEKVEIIPFFWINLAGMNLRYVGYAKNWDETIIEGDLSNNDFTVYYSNNSQITAVLGSNRDEQIAVVEELMRTGRMPTTEEIKSSRHHSSGR
jgi:NADPH-dependent 2,4-dienoyl-CoA reductase/sulfur reductase-like enzyme/nitrite reductase/ring-hydroxylating ferredoxin subunit